MLRGEARFIAPDTLTIDGRRLTARPIVIVAGSRAVVPPVPSLDQVPFPTNAALSGLTERPEHLLILGGGPIGLLLVAAGRRPHREGRGLEAGGVRASLAGITTDRGLRLVSNRRVFAVGDIAYPLGIGSRACNHVGSYHAGIVIRRALFRLPARLDDAARR